jgi:hypothetical protein
VRQTEYDLRRSALEQQLHDDLELIRASYQAKVRALDSLLEKDHDEEIEVAGETPSDDKTPEPAEPPEARRPKITRMAVKGGLKQMVRDVLPQLPEVFDRYELMEALGFEPHRTTLLRALNKLVADGRITLDYLSNGRQPTRYQKVAGPD